MGKKVFIHAGSHRSGSSSFQQCLADNRPALDALGYDVAYPGRDGAPGGGLRLRLPAPRHRNGPVDKFTQQAGRTLHGLSPDPDRPLILSEENIPGRMLPFFQGQFFPVAALRMKTLAKALDAPPAHVVYVVRNYADLYVSAYRKRAEDKKSEPFRDLVPNLMNMDRGWPELVRDIQETLAPEALTIVDYACRGESRGMLAGLIGRDAPSDLREPDRVVNRSATDAALFAVQARLRIGQPLEEAERRAILAEHAGYPRSLGFAEFTQDERATLDALYARDLDRIGDIPGVTLRRATPGAQARAS